MSIPKLIGPNFEETPIATYGLSESQLILPLPEDVRDYGEKAPSEIDLKDDSKVFVGNPAKMRQIDLLLTSWNYIVKSSSLIAGQAHLRVYIYSVHSRTGLKNDSVFNPEILKKWIMFDLSETYTAERENLLEHMEYNNKLNENISSEELDLENYFSYPRSEDNLVINTESNTPKCSFQQGVSTQRLRNSLFIPISKNHISVFHLDFGGFGVDLVGTKEETDELTKNYAKEFFSHVRVEYNAELKEELAKHYNEK